MQVLSCKSLYNLEPVELETLKTYAKTHLSNGFIKPSKDTTIFFINKLDKIMRLYVNFRELNNLIIKNQYPCLLIDKSLD